MRVDRYCYYFVSLRTREREYRCRSRGCCVCVENRTYVDSISGWVVVVVKVEVGRVGGWGGARLSITARRGARNVKW
jgi:hypothetical protein